ncbi:MAG: sigma-54 dependent transcriptional regulator [Planctomycetota bacterium]
MSLKVLVVDDKRIMRDSVGATLQRAGFNPIAAGSGPDALDAVAKHAPAAVVTDLRMPDMTGLELLAKLREADAELPVLLMTAYGRVEEAVEAMKLGAFDFIQKPFEGDALVTVVRRAIDDRKARAAAASAGGGGSGTRRSQSGAPAGESVPALVGKGTAMKAIARQIHQIAGSQGTVLIQGESGTGKEVVARAIHAHSPRRDKLMLCLNCAALSSSLLESELFGHERGAFTGADQLRKGRFELANGGTLLLDEVSEISPQLQAKLLRVLQEGQFERVGSSVPIAVDVRVLATTNRDLSRSVADGSFRQDLYYRLNVLPIVLPALHERREDIPGLVEHFLQRVGEREDKPAKRVEDEAMSLLQAYGWPGNVRELQNICERASVMTRGQLIRAATVRPWLETPRGVVAPGAGHVPASPGASAVSASPADYAGGVLPRTGGSPPLQTPVAELTGYQSPNPQLTGAPLPGALVEPTVAAIDGYGPPAAGADGAVRSLEELERDQILRTLGRFGGNRTRTAEALGIGVRTLGLKLKKWKEQQLVAATV